MLIVRNTFYLKSRIFASFFDMLDSPVSSLYSCFIFSYLPRGNFVGPCLKSRFAPLLSFVSSVSETVGERWSAATCCRLKNAFKNFLFFGHFSNYFTCIIFCLVLSDWFDFEIMSKFFIDFFRNPVENVHIDKMSYLSHF